MNDLTSFAFEGRALRVVVRDGEPWFVATDVATGLDFRDAATAIKSVPASEKGTHKVRTPGGYQALIIINEPALYRLIFRSNKPEAKRLQDFVFGDVLPAIRRTGQYLPPTPSHTDLGPAIPAPIDEMTRRMQLVQEFRMSHTREETRRFWREMGLPFIEEKPLPEDLACLNHMLDHTWDGKPLRQRINDLFNGTRGDSGVIFELGIRTVGAGFILPMGHRRVAELYAGTRWPRPFEYWMRLPGAQLGAPQGGRNARDFVWVPSHYLG